ncbi:MAG: LptE family protein [Kiritimatiellae bacterium]|nr:LptE family protein [Kiritimatiellia bacterium]
MRTRPPTFRPSRWLTALVLIGLIAGGASCANYRLGSSLPADIQTVFIPVFENRTDEPLIENEVTREVISRIQRDGALRIAPEAEADAILKVTLRRFIFTPIAYDDANRDTPNEYRMILSAAFVLYRPSTGQTIVEHPAAQGETLVLLSGDMSTSKRMGLPEASRDLARDLTEKILEAW